MLSTHASPLKAYPVSQLHLAYKLPGAVDHVCILFHPLAASYHHSKTELALFGIHRCLTSPPSTKIIAPVHPFEYTFIDGETK